MQRTPIYIICSPRPHVGKTLVARLLVEFLLLQRGAVTGFDINLNEPSLLDYQPKLTETADISDTFGQMQLMDRLIVHDGIAKVIDLGFHAFGDFFKMLAEIGFMKEAERRSVNPIVLFVLDRDNASARALAMLKQTFPGTAIVAINNEQILFGEIPDWADRVRKIDVGILPDFLKGYIARTNFSFTGFVRDTNNSSSELYDWIRNNYRHFRELELNLILHQL